MSRYRRIAQVLARRCFDPSSGFAESPGAELRSLVGALCDAGDSDWVLEDGKDERRLANLVKALNYVIDDYVARRMTPPLRPTSTVTFFRFTIWSDPDEDEAERDVRARLRLHQPMLECLRALDPGDFERLCSKVLQAVGCENVHVTRGSQDLGSDFFGRLPASGGTVAEIQVGPRHRVLGSVWLLVFGQAKRYADYNKITLDTIKLIESTWFDVLRLRQAGALPQNLDAGLEQIGWCPGDAVRYMFVTTAYYTGPAMRWAETAGAITLDGDQLAQLLLEAEIGIEHDADAGAYTTSVELVAAACAG